MNDLNQVTDYTFFRKKGMELIRKLSDLKWTDHNTHDPGITILEQLCYALTDLSYRINFPISDLMAEGGMMDWPDSFRPALMLSSGPLHLTDWRKLLIDTNGVRNAWIYPLDATSEQYDARVFYDPIERALRMSIPMINRDTQRNLAPLDLLGLYRVAFIAEPGQNPINVKNSIRQRLHEHRNLCEDFHQIDPLSSKGVNVEGEVDIGDVSDPAALLAQIYFVIQEYLSPRIQFYTLQERLEKGYPVEEILEGPLLDHGFLDDQELEAFQLRQSVRISDILRLIMNLEGVLAVRHLRLSIPRSSIDASTKQGEPWEMIIPDNHSPVLIIPAFPTEKTVPSVGIQLFKKGLLLRIDWKIAWRWLDGLNQKEKKRTKPIRQETTRLGPANGHRRQIGVYQSIQHQFPDTYGIGKTGLSKSAPPHRIAQARQFKAYLAIFDQLLANAFAQLAGVGKIFSLIPGTFEKMYFSQSMRDEIPDFESLINWRKIDKPGGHSSTKLRKTDTPEDKTTGYQEQLQVYTQGGVEITTKQSLWDRRNRLFNHLLARFGEQINEHDATLKDKLFVHKESFLNEYPSLGRQRGKAFDYTRPYFQETFEAGATGEAAPMNGRVENVAGLERRLAALLGLSKPIRRRLSNLPNDDEGGFHLVEHILLRPGKGDKGQQSPILQLPVIDDESRPPLTDPFSLQLSFIFPSWLDRFNEDKNPAFRKAVIKTLRDETPAHIRIYVRWLSQMEMAAFEESFLNWINQLKAH